jgi:MFS family permease
VHDAVVVALAGRLRAPFYRYWLSEFLSDFGNGVRLAAFPLLAAQLTRSPGAVAAVTAVQGLPWLLLGAGAGVIVDRVDRRRLMVAADIARAALIAVLAAAVLAGHAGLALIYPTAFGTGVGSALRTTAAVTCVPRMVEQADLDKANGRMAAGQIVGFELAGPAAGGWLFGAAAVLPFAVNAGTLGIAVLLLLTLPAVFAAPPRPESGAARPRLASARHDLAEGLRWVWRHPDIRDVTIMAGVVSAMDAAWFAVFVLYVVKVLHQPPGAYGLLIAVGAIGGIAASATTAAVTRRIGPWRSLLAAGLGVAVTQTALGLTSSVIAAAVFQVFSIWALTQFSVTAVTMRQRQVPDALLGRVTSVYGTVTQGAEALGAIAGGGIAVAAGIRAPMLIGAGPIAIVTIGVAWRHRHRETDDAAPSEAG